MVLLSTALAATLQVGSSGYATIQAAIDAATPGDEIVVAPGTWDGFTYRGRSVTVRSSDGAATTTIDGLSGYWAVLVDSGESAVLDGFTVTNADGGGIGIARSTFTGRNLVVTGVGYAGATTPGLYAESSVVAVETSTFSDNVSGYGAHLLTYGGTTSFVDCTFEGGEATNGGAMYLTSGAVVSVTGGTVQENAAETYGGAFFASAATLQLDGVTIFSNYGYYGGAAWIEGWGVLDDDASTWDTNTSYADGGAVYGYNGFTATHVGSTFVENLATYGNGGAWRGYYGIPTFQGVTFRENVGTYGGGAILFSELYNTATFTDSTFERNTGTYSSGGAIYAQYYSHLAISGTTFTGNRSYRGGALYSYYGQDVTVSDSTFSGNAATLYEGGAVSHSYDASGYGVLTVSGSAFLDNTAANEGGAISALSPGVTTLLDNRFVRNESGSASFGGGAFVFQPEALVARRNTFASNVGNYGGALYVDAPARAATVTNNRFLENVAEDGGAFCLVNGGTHVWANNTFVGNAATEFGGTGCLYGTAATFTNNAVAWTGDGAAIHDYTAQSGAVFSYNAWFENTDGATSGETTDVLAAAGSITVDPMFVAWSNDGDDLNDNLRLLVGSPLDDAGDPAVLDPDGTRSDVGAYGGPEAPGGDADGDGYDASGDCDDAAPGVHPGAAESWYDGVNQDCAGDSDYDQDGDGVDAEVHGGTDCDDLDASSVAPCVTGDTGDTADTDGGDGNGGEGGGGGSEGCGCASSNAPDLAWLLALLFLRRR